MRQRLLFFFFLGFVSMASSSTFLGNGGGLAELHFMKATQDFKQIRSLCLAPSNPCVLKTAELGLLNEAGPLAKFTIQFLKERTQKNAWFASSNREILYVSSPSLYQADEKPLPYAEITRIAYLALLGEEPAAAHLVDQLLGRFTFELAQVLYGTINGQSLMVQVLKKQEVSDSIFLELPKASYDIGEFFEQTPLCPYPQRIAFRKVRLVRDFYDVIRLVGQVSVQCRDRRQTGDFQLDLSIQGEQSLKSELRYFYVRTEDL